MLTIQSTTLMARTVGTPPNGRPWRTLLRECEWKHLSAVLFSAPRASGNPRTSSSKGHVSRGGVLVSNSSVSAISSLLWKIYGRNRHRDKHLRLFCHLDVSPFSDLLNAEWDIGLFEFFIWTATYWNPSYNTSKYKIDYFISGVKNSRLWISDLSAIHEEATRGPILFNVKLSEIKSPKRWLKHILCIYDHWIGVILNVFTILCYYWPKNCAEKIIKGRTFAVELRTCAIAYLLITFF